MKRYILSLVFCGLLGQSVQANDYRWSNEIAGCVNTYFKKAYKHAPNDKIRTTIQGQPYTVNRPNHALAHGMRQGFLASDIVYGMQKLASATQNLSQETRNFITWINNKIAADKSFIRKIQFVSSFQRTGRGSEVSSQSNPQLYHSYKLRDADNLGYFARVKNFIGSGKLFKDQAELQLYKEVLCPTGQLSQGQQTDFNYLSKIINASHELDLRRVTGFSAQTIQAQTKNILFGSAQLQLTEMNFLAKLWTRSGEYLWATGDRDIVTRKTHYSLRFFTQAHHPNKLVGALHQARSKSSVSF